jgi:hypothetical protein
MSLYEHSMGNVTRHLCLKLPAVRLYVVLRQQGNPNLSGLWCSDSGLCHMIIALRHACSSISTGRLSRT